MLNHSDVYVAISNLVNYRMYYTLNQKQEHNVIQDKSCILVLTVSLELQIIAWLQEPV